jgi:hypothetical protein
VDGFGRSGLRDKLAGFEQRIGRPKVQVGGWLAIRYPARLGFRYTAHGFLRQAGPDSGRNRKFRRLDSGANRTWRRRSPWTDEGGIVDFTTCLRADPRANSVRSCFADLQGHGDLAQAQEQARAGRAL